MKLIIGISGASGVMLAKKFISKLPKEVNKYVVSTKNSDLVSQKENNLTIFDNNSISEPIASGSFGSDAMIVLPCSSNSLAKIACGISDNLLTRTASVIIKEQKKLILCVREMPFSPIMLENMHKLSTLGVSIAPPIMGYYSKQQTLEEMENFLIGKWLDLLNIKNNIYERWNG
jgi:4-hydroxy-3-polyprenylbenzoate decarboxylase